MPQEELFKYIRDIDEKTCYFNSAGIFLYGGSNSWGGRFEKTPELDHVYKDAVDDGDNKKSLRIWIDDVNRDFQARMDWCVADRFEDANHHPIVRIKAKLDRRVASGDKGSKPESIHIILEVSDNGDPVLKSDRRIIVKVVT